MKNRAFIFSTTAFLLIIPVTILSASFLNMVQSGDDGAIISVKSDVTLYTYKNIRASFNKAACSYFLLSGSDTTKIKGNLTDVWSPYMENNYTGLNIKIAESKINVTYDSITNSITVGNIDDMNEWISVNVSQRNSTIEGGLGPLEISSTCDVATAT